MNIIKSELSLEKYAYNSVIELVIDRLQTDSDGPCMIDCMLNRKWNKRQVLESSLNFAYYLITECEVKNGDIILLVKNNSGSHGIAIIGVLAAGAVYCSLPEHFSEREIEEICRNINPTIVICCTQKDMLISQISGIASVKKVLVIEQQTHYMNDEKNGLTFDKLFNQERKSDIALPRAGDVKDTITLVLSSGSTGRSKAIMKTNENFLAIVAAFQHPQICPLTAQDIYAIDDLYHSPGQFAFFACLNTGAQLAITQNAKNGMDDHHMFQAIHDFNITTAFVVPTQMNFLSKNSDKYNEAFIPTLREVICGGAYLSDAIFKSINERFQFSKFRRSYGMSEAGVIITLYSEDLKHLTNLATIGKLCPGFECKVIDQTGVALGPNETGQLCFKGKQIIPGYLNNDEVNAQLFTHDHFMKSGDIGYYDVNGYFYFVSRLKEVVFVQGVIVSPKELETILLQNQEIENAAVIGIEDQEFGEMPLAFVQLIKGSDLTPKQIQQFVDNQVNYYKKLRGGVKIVNKFPLTTTGKISKIELKKLYLI